jgi:hypothetical protein
MQGKLTVVGQTTEAIRDNKQKKGIGRRLKVGAPSTHSLTQFSQLIGPVTAGLTSTPDHLTPI